MNILFLNAIPIIPYIGGVQKVTDCIARELIKRGHIVSFVYYEKRNIPEDYVFPCKQYYVSHEGRAIAETKDEWLKILHDNNIEIVVNLSSNAHSLYYLQLIGDKSKIVTIQHLRPFGGLPYNRYSLKCYDSNSMRRKFLICLRFLFPNFMARFAIREQRRQIKSFIDVSNIYCVLSKSYVDRIIKYYPEVEIGKICFIPNPTPYSIERIDFPSKDNLIVVVGRIVRHKYLDSFIDMWRVFSKKNPDWKALIIGSGEDEHRVMKYAQSKKVRNLMFTGAINDVRPYYRKAKIVCGTSISESWNMSLVEGMCLGCVPVAFDSYEALEDIIDNNVNGILVKPFNINQMINDMQIMVDNPKQMAIMSERAQQKITSMSVNRIVDYWEKLFNEI